MYGAVRDEWRASGQVSQSVLHDRNDAVVIPTEIYRTRVLRS